MRSWIWEERRANRKQFGRQPSKDEEWKPEEGGPGMSAELDRAKGEGGRDQSKRRDGGNLIWKGSKSWIDEIPEGGVEDGFQRNQILAKKTVVLPWSLLLPVHGVSRAVAMQRFGG
jgi:hypothetical protein